ncbi:hypothetical protein AAHE18_18G160700 [Arachis hypogaea]
MATMYDAFFLGLQIKQTPNRIFIHQGKYAKELVKKFGLENSKPMSTPMHLNTKLNKDENGKDVDETRYRGMIGSLMYLTSSRSDIIKSMGVCSRYIKGTSDLVGYCNADFTSNRVDRRSTSGIYEAEYISASSCCPQLIWLKTQLADYEFVINISKNLVLYSRTKYIESQGTIDIQFVNLEDQLANIFTKPLCEDRFYKLRTALRMVDAVSLI